MSRADTRVDAKVLRQVAECAAQRAGVRDDVDVVEPDAAGGWNLQRGHRAHERRLAGAVRPEQAEHPARDFQRDRLERARTVRIDMRELVDAQHTASRGGGDWLTDGLYRT